MVLDGYGSTDEPECVIPLRHREVFPFQADATSHCSRDNIFVPPEANHEYGGGFEHLYVYGAESKLGHRIMLVMVAPALRRFR